MRMLLPQLPPPHRLASARWCLPLAALLAACTGQIGDRMDSETTGSPTGSGGSQTTSSTTGGTAGSGTTTAGGGTGGTSTGGAGGAGGSSGIGGSTIAPPPATCENKIVPGRAPLRRITRYEYNNTVHDLLDDTMNPGSQLPGEVQANTFDLFGNNADSQPVSRPLIDAYSDTAADVAARATKTATVMAKFDACATSAPSASAATQATCARKVIQNLASKAYRRAVTTTEVDDLVALYTAYASPGFLAGMSTVLEGILQSADFLYRPEFGGPKDSAHPDVLRPTGDEMATRLSYTLWGTAPDDALRAAAQKGDLDTPDGVRAQATRMLDDPKAKQQVRFFFDKLLPIESLTDIARTDYPNFSPTIGSYMREETQTFLANEIFGGQGTWKGIMNAPYTYVNEPLAKFYGMTGVTGMDFQKTNLDTTKRKGLLTQGGVMTGTITSNDSNPVLRGSFVLNKLLCRHLTVPTDPKILAQVKVPVVDGRTARERFTQHSTQAVCHSCHQFLDPPGFALENFDAVGNYRTQDSGETIDASGTLDGIGTFKNAVELVDELAASDEAQTCFASHWLDFAYGRQLNDDDECVASRINVAFEKSGFNVKNLLLELTQTDAFLYMPAVKE